MQPELHGQITARRTRQQVAGRTRSPVGLRGKGVDLLKQGAREIVERRE